MCAAFPRGMTAILQGGTPHSALSGPAAQNRRGRMAKVRITAKCDECGKEIIHVGGPCFLRDSHLPP